MVIFFFFFFFFFFFKKKKKKKKIKYDRMTAFHPQRLLLSSTKRQVFTTRCRKAGRNGCAMVKAADLLESYLCVGSDRVSPRHLASLEGMGGRNAYRADRGYRAGP